MAKKATTTFVPETLEPRIYEIGFLLSPAVRDEDLEARTTEFKESLTNLGATVFAEGAPEFIDLAYEMAKIIENKRVRFNQGYFGWVKIEMDPAQMTVLKETLDKNMLLVRYLLISTTKENTVIGKKPLGKILKGERAATSLEGEVPEIIEDIEVDKADDFILDEPKEVVIPE